MIKTVDTANLNIDVASMKVAVDTALLALLDRASRILLSTYHNWDDKPVWKKVGPRTVNGNRELIYQTDSTPYVWVDEGTDGPYTISPKNAPFLRFKVGGKPMTWKGSMMSTAGVPGTAWRTALSVEHPGIESRDFTETAAKELEGIAADSIQAAIDKEVAKWL